MHTNKRIILLYHIKKAVAKSFAVLFSVLLILSNFNITYADTASIFTLTPTFSRQYNDGLFSPSYSYTSIVKWDLRDLGLDNGDTYSVEFDVVGSGSQWGTYGIGTYAYSSDRLTNDAAGSAINSSLGNIKSNGHYSGSYTISSNYYGFGFSTKAYGDYTVTISNLTITSDSIIIIPPEPATTYNFTLQNGWLSVIDLGTSGASYDLELNTSFAEYSHLSEPWWDSTQRYWFTDTMPEVGSTITNSETGILITWDKTGNTDLFDRSKSAVASLSGTASGRYMIIYNPAYHQFDAFGIGPKQESNLPLNIAGIPQGAPVSLFKMDESMHLTGGITSQFISSAGSAVATGSALNITDTFVDSDGNSVVQNSGGANDIHESSGIVSYIVSINDTLDNFTNQFIQLLSAPIVHIQQLISSGTNFFNAFGSLFSFLPTEVYQVVIGAFIVMVVIGVIKLLL